ncbi:MAG: pyridoxamine 5'-phosphate oxidase family protein [Thermomicrobiales bacterium]
MTEAANDEGWRGKGGRMSQDEMEAFLATDVLCRLGCLDEKGWPYVIPVWFQYRDGGFYVIPRQRSAWATMLQHDERVYLTMDETGPQRKVLVKGQAELIEEPNIGGRWVEIAREMSYRYLGEHGPDYLVPTLNEPRWLFFVRPLKITTWQGVDWAKRYKHRD